MRKLLLAAFALSALISCNLLKKNTQKDYTYKSHTEKKMYLRAYDKSLKLWGVPFQEENIQTSLGTAHVIMAGPKDAPPLVLLHGMDATSTMWYPNIKSLSKNNRVYAIDFLKEVGKSQSTEKSLSKSEIVSWYNEIFDFYKLKKTAIVGASRGGWLATLLAVEKNSRINKLILLSPAQTFQNIDQVGKATSALVLKTFPTKKQLDKTLASFSYYPEKIHTDFKRQYFLSYKVAKRSSNFLQMQPFSDDDFKDLNIPVLVIIGDHDIVNSDLSLERTKKYLSNSKTEKVKNAGHFLSIDQSETVNKLIVNFLK